MNGNSQQPENSTRQKSTGTKDDMSSALREATEHDANIGVSLQRTEGTLRSAFVKSAHVAADRTDHATNVNTGNGVLKINGEAEADLRDIYGMDKKKHNMYSTNLSAVEEDIPDWIKSDEEVPFADIMRKKFGSLAQTTPKAKTREKAGSHKSASTKDVVKEDK